MKLRNEELSRARDELSRQRDQLEAELTKLKLASTASATTTNGTLHFNGSNHTLSVLRACVRVGYSRVIVAPHHLRCSLFSCVCVGSTVDGGGTTGGGITPSAGTGDTTRGPTATDLHRSRGGGAHRRRAGAADAHAGRAISATIARKSAGTALVAVVADEGLSSPRR